MLTLISKYCFILLRFYCLVQRCKLVQIRCLAPNPQ
ncbi:Uncharacterised protein [Segatella copri]|nr:Uncharacterised protein [Segatella copri]